jgi:hypothetical protein
LAKSYSKKGFKTAEAAARAWDEMAKQVGRTDLNFGGSTSTAKGKEQLQEAKPKKRKKTDRTGAVGMDGRPLPKRTSRAAAAVPMDEEAPPSPSVPASMPPPVTVPPVLGLSGPALASASVPPPVPVPAPVLPAPVAVAGLDLAAKVRAVVGFLAQSGVLSEDLLDRCLFAMLDGNARAERAAELQRMCEGFGDDEILAKACFARKVVKTLLGEE